MREVPAARFSRALAPRCFGYFGIALLQTWTFGCEQPHTLEPTVNAKPGIEQIEALDDPIDEDVACAMLHEALIDARDGADCNAVDVLDCPELIRPGGSLACIRYSESSVEECVSRVNDYDSCDDFVERACIIAAIVDETTEGCIPPGASTDGGTGPDDAGGGDDVPDDDESDAGAPPSANLDAGNEGVDAASVEPEPDAPVDASIAPVDAGAPAPIDAGAEPADAGSMPSGVVDAASPLDAGL